MEINKHFKDLGSIVKAIIKVVDLSKVQMEIGADPRFPNEVVIKLVTLPNYQVIVFYPWSVRRGSQNLYIPDEVCLPYIGRHGESTLPPMGSYKTIPRF